MKKIDKIILECYTELFANSTPKGDFMDMYNNASINERGEKEIPFMDYEIDGDTLYAVINSYTTQIKPKYLRQKFMTTILLGCSPRIKKNV